MSDVAGFEVRGVLADEAATERLGAVVGARLRPGQAVALLGDLGAGKTCFARGIGRGMGIDDPDAVCSPTYLLVIEHPGPLPMIHIDAYLPDKTRAFLADGGIDYLAERRGVAVVEWADRLADLLPVETLWVTLAPAPCGSGREVVLVDRTAGAFPFLRDVRESLFE
ncbi:MAG: tRNA (adenosine(37)-N6)-threonylcarbamoyltransferase complex ATPase subunit type 1 TsaE [Planctomycetes bacterium]|nr:tRNA (adenosine(37)-N6)-threonylcarbamoyltransferase complex ATPase subunit type 1 TsaE [Planctomycetota bacterium]